MGAPRQHGPTRLSKEFMGSVHRRTMPMVVAVVLLCGACLVQAASARASTDVTIVFDATGSMSDALGEAESQISDVIGQIDSRYSDVQYAVASVRDYAGLYGDEGDEPWTLLQPMTSDRNAIAGAIGGLVAQGGGDEPEAYGRALYEADHDPAIGYRPGAKRLVVLVADSVPHDNDLNQGIDPSVQTQGSPFDTGVDPGPDGIVGTSDDIDWQSELSALKADGLPLYFVLFKGDASLLPYWQTWAGVTGGSASDSSSGQLGNSLVTAISAGASGCGRAFDRLGVVDVCADQITPQGDGTALATGSVRIDGGIDAGSGPVTIDPSAQTVSAGSGGALGVIRANGTIPFASGAYTVQTDGATDDVSGRSNLAALTIAGSSVKSLIVGGLGLSPLGKFYLDHADGGGIVLTADPLIQLFGQGPKGTLSLGIHAQSSSTWQILGGSAGWDAKFGPGSNKWGLGFNLSYNGTEDTWKAEGEGDFPRVLGGVAVSGSLRRGKIDSLGLTIKAGDKGIPLGDTGFFFDSFSGEVSGLAKRPVKITAGVTGGWGIKIPVVEKRPLSLEKAEVSVASDLSGTIKGTVGIVDRRVAGGDLDVSMKLHPFKASGSLDVDVTLLGTGFTERGAIDMNPDHFTATGGASFTVAGQRLVGGSAVVSDLGAGASGKPCAICPTVGAGIKWKNALSFPPKPEWIGADIDRFRTIRGAGRASAAGQRIRVRPRTSVLAVYTRGSASGLQLISPRGRPVAPGQPGTAVDQTSDGRLAFTVLNPIPGTWTLSGQAAGAIEVDRVPPLGKLVIRSAGPRGDAHHGLSRNEVISLRWRLAGHLPRDSRVTVQRSAHRGGGGIPVAAASAARRSIRFRASQLTGGSNHLSLVLSSGGIPFQRIAVGGTFHRATPRRARRHHGKH
jgi:hypothetical protein